VLTTHDRMLEAQIVQEATFSSTLSDKLPSKPEPNPREHCNYVTVKEEIEVLTDLEEVPMEGGRKIIMGRSKERNNGGKTVAFEENNTVEFPAIFPSKLPDPSSFSIPYIVGKVKVETALCDLGEIVSTMPYSLFHKLHLGPLLAAPFSL